VEAQERLLRVVAIMSWHQEQTHSFKNVLELSSSEARSFCDFRRLVLMSLVNIAVIC